MSTMLFLKRGVFELSKEMVNSSIIFINEIRRLEDVTLSSTAITSIMKIRIVVKQIEG